jgi:hypothetical protein
MKIRALSRVVMSIARPVFSRRQLELAGHSAASPVRRVRQRFAEWSQSIVRGAGGRGHYRDQATARRASDLVWNT